MKLVFLTKIYWIGLDNPTYTAVYAASVGAIEPIVRDNFNGVSHVEVDRIIPLLTDINIINV